MLKHPKLLPIIDARLAELGENMAEETEFTIARAMQTYLDIFEADPNELIGLRVGCCRHCYGDGHGYQWREHEYLAATTLAEKADKELPDIAGGFDYDHTLPPLEDCPECRGEGISRIIPQDSRKLSPGGKILFQGVKHTKDGPQIIFADKNKALESAAKIVGAFVERVKVEGVTANVDLTGMTATEAAKAYADMIKGT